MDGKHGSIVGMIIVVLLMAGCAASPGASGPGHPTPPSPPQDVAIPANSRMAKIRLGMGLAEITQLVGRPTDQETALTGKAFIPYYFGGDQSVTTMYYKGLGRLYMSGHGTFGGGGRVMKIEYDPHEKGFRK